MLIALDPQDQRPIYLQIIAQIKQQIQTGQLRPGDELPSVRELAESLNINLHTVHHAYKELREQGVIYLRLGQRAKIAKLRQTPAPRAEVESALAGRMRELLTEAFHLGLSSKDFRKLVDEIIAAEK
jgi:GntR family transcriptional regulator